MFLFQTPLLLQNFTASNYEFFCDPSVSLPSFNGTAVAVLRGNCTFSEKAILAQQNGAAAVIIVSDVLVSQC